MRRTSRMVLFISAITCAALSPAATARAEKPGPVGFRLVYAHTRQGAQLSADSPLCAAGGSAEAARFADRIDKVLTSFEADRSRTPPKDLGHPDVIRAIAWADALAACRDAIRSPPTEAPEPVVAAGDASPDKPDEADEADEAPEALAIGDTGEGTLEDFQRAVPAELRATLAALASLDPAAPSTFPDAAATVAAMHAAAKALWPHCTGSFAALVMGGAPEEVPALDGDPWRLCQAAATHAVTLKRVAEGLLARATAALDTARAKAEAIAAGVEAEVDAARAALEAAAGEAGARLEDAALTTEALLAAAIAEVDVELTALTTVAALAGAEAEQRVGGAVAAAEAAVRKHKAAAEAFVRRLGEDIDAKAREALEGALKKVSPKGVLERLGFRPKRSSRPAKANAR